MKDDAQTRSAQEEAFTKYFNVFLDPLFIFVFRMGIGGAGLATAIANYISFFYYITMFCRRRKTTVVCFDPRYYRAGDHICTEVLAVGIPAGLMLMCMNICDFVRNYFFNLLGGQMELAAWGVVQKIGNSFIPSGDSVPTAVSYLRVWIFCLIGIGFVELFNAIFQAIGKWKISMANTIINKGLLLTPVMALMASLWGIGGIIISQPITEDGTALVLLFIYLWIIKREASFSGRAKNCNN